MSSRERKIIELLCQVQDDVTIKEIANSLQVSERTIHRDLKHVEEILTNNHVTLVKRSGSGLRVSGTMEAKQELIQVISSLAPSEYTTEERQAIVLSTLLESNEPIKLFTLASELHVTIATISNDLDQVERDLGSFDLVLIRRRGYGVEIKGEEIKKRAALSQLITKYVEPFKLITLSNDEHHGNWNQPSAIISSRLLESVDQKKLINIQDAVEKARKYLPHELADNAYIGLVVHLALAMERLQKGEQIQFDSEYLKQINQTKEYEIARNIIEDLEHSFGMKIPEDEIGYITMHLMGAKLQLSKPFLIEDSSMDIAVMATELIQFVSSNLDVNLNNNVSLLNDLVAHLKPTVYRLKQGMPIKNPMLDVIKNDYLELFDLISRGVGDIFTDMTFPEAEIGYLVLHFAATLLNEKDLHIRSLVICASGIGTAKILASKLLQKVPEIKTVENKSLFDLDNLNLTDYDVIISTVPLAGVEREYILTSPMLTDTEIRRIQKLIRKRKIQPTSQKKSRSESSEDTQQHDLVSHLKTTQIYAQIVIELLEGFAVHSISEHLSMREILQRVCLDLEAVRVIKDKGNIQEKLIKREQLGGLGIPGTSMALFHTRSDDIVVPSMRIYPLRNPLNMKGMDHEEMQVDTVLMMLAPEKTSKEVLEVLSFISNLFIQHEDNARLFESGNEARIKEFLSKQFQKFLKEKNLL
ncbi:BglG family transcription antiterminator [Ornithinibacillus xuwenensis]|uniref:BglG family transcription antiterminator n=1 Tax=Ornithinibacillus xuwenensis TaxID=3144668 RepID=A0ABU9XL88_9BACI